MNDNESRRHQMFVRVRDFGIAHSRDFDPGSLGTSLFTSLASIITELDGHAATQASGIGSARQGTSTRAQARDALREDLEAINRTATAMADDVTGIDDKFQIPRNNNDQHLLNAARAFATDATPLSAQFIAHELPANFLADLNSDIAALEAAISNQGSAVGNHVGSGAAIDDTVGRGVDTVRKLDAIVKNRYPDNPSILAEWTSASHTERAPRSGEKATPPPQPPQPPQPSGTQSSPTS